MAVTGPSSPAAPRQPPCGERLSADARYIRPAAGTDGTHTPAERAFWLSSRRIACNLKSLEIGGVDRSN
jgi:hypothetical protein